MTLFSFSASRNPLCNCRTPDRLCSVQKKPLEVIGQLLAGRFMEIREDQDIHLLHERHVYLFVEDISFYG